MNTKQLQKYLYWALIGALLLYFLYQKGIIASNFESISPKEAYTLMQDDINDSYVVLDVRTKEEYYQEGHIKNALLLPLATIDKQLDKLSGYKERTLIVYCRSGNRSVSAARILSNHGFRVINMRGGITMWNNEGLSLVKE